uniref:virulence factor TspB C-terminal domain-related protein n=1 Tax=Psychrobacter sp. TaxID=56811 RepID=UPI001599AE1A|nr:virulence factor TspB C-terminal domain-related protein [Psychrobacter sp.]QJS05422.1 hypothetical protein [Psychrobacter sp.]
MRKIIIYMLSLVMVFAPAIAANAATSMGGWTALDTITAGANNTITATKTAGGKVLKSAITVAPQAGKVGKLLLRGGAVGALAMAVPQILGQGVDWVLDPANNAVKYKNPDYSPSPLVYGYRIRTGAFFSTPDAVCVDFVRISNARFNGTTYTFVSASPSDCALSGVLTSDGGDYKLFHVPIDYVSTPVVDPSLPANDEYKFLPIDIVAAKVVGNAEAGHVPSQEAVKAVALEGFEAGDYDTALESAAIPDSAVDTDTPPTDTPTDPTKPFDPAGILSAIAALKAVLAGLVAAVVGLSDFFQSDPPPEKPSQDVPVDTLPPTKSANEFDVNYVSFGGQCPVLPSFNVGVGSVSTTMQFDVTPLCDLAVMIRPAIIAISYFIGLGVIASAIRET